MGNSWHLFYAGDRLAGWSALLDHQLDSCTRKTPKKAVHQGQGRINRFFLALGALDAGEPSVDDEISPCGK